MTASVTTGPECGWGDHRPATYVLVHQHDTGDGSNSYTDLLCNGCACLVPVVLPGSAVRWHLYRLEAAGHGTIQVPAAAGG